MFKNSIKLNFSNFYLALVASILNYRHAINSALLFYIAYPYWVQMLTLKTIFIGLTGQLTCLACLIVPFAFNGIFTMDIKTSFNDHDKNAPHASYTSMQNMLPLVGLNVIIVFFFMCIDLLMETTGVFSYLKWLAICELALQSIRLWLINTNRMTIYNTGFFPKASILEQDDLKKFQQEMGKLIQEANVTADLKSDIHVSFSNSGSYYDPQLNYINLGHMESKEDYAPRYFLDLLHEVKHRINRDVKNQSRLRHISLVFLAFFAYNPKALALAFLARLSFHRMMKQCCEIVADEYALEKAYSLRESQERTGAVLSYYVYFGSWNEVLKEIDNKYNILQRTLLRMFEGAHPVISRVKRIEEIAIKHKDQGIIKQIKSYKKRYTTWWSYVIWDLKGIRIFANWWQEAHLKIYKAWVKIHDALFPKPVLSKSPQIIIGSDEWFKKAKKAHQAARNGQADVLKYMTFPSCTM